MKTANIKLTFLLLITLMVTKSYSQNNILEIDESRKDSLKIQANRFASAFLTHNSKIIVKYSYDGIIDRFFNGEKNVESSFEVGAKDAEVMGFKIINLELGLISEFGKAKNEMYAFIQTKFTSLIKDDTLKSESFYLAISKDDGLNWTFIDESFILVAGIKTLFPNYNEEIPIPKKMEPNFIKKNGN